MRYQLAFIITITLSLSASSKTRIHKSTGTSLDTAVLGKYHAGYSDIGSDLILNKDGSFILKNYHYTDVNIENDGQQEMGRLKIYYGTFSLHHNTISLTPKVLVRRKALKIREVLQDSVAYYESDTTSLARNFSVIKWIGNIYLLSAASYENDFIAFANHYNSGGEPGLSSSYFAKRWNTERHKQIDVSQLPKKWRGYILDSVIHVRITKVDKNVKYNKPINIDYWYEINKGKQHGIKKGMILYGKYCCSLLIMEVTQTSSKGIIAHCPFNQDACKTGDVLVSWNEQDHGKFENRFQRPVTKKFRKK